MALPLAVLPLLPALAAKALGAPLGAKAAAGAATALAIWAVARRARRDAGHAPEAETALDATPEGFEAGWRRAAHGRAAEGSASAAWRGVIRLGASGPGIAFDAAALGRLRLGLAPAAAAARSAPVKETAR